MNLWEDDHISQMMIEKHANRYTFKFVIKNFSLDFIVKAINFQTFLFEFFHACQLDAPLNSKSI